MDDDINCDDDDFRMMSSPTSLSIQQRCHDHVFVAMMTNDDAVLDHSIKDDIADVTLLTTTTSRQRCRLCVKVVIVSRYDVVVDDDIDTTTGINVYVGNDVVVM